MLRIGEFSLSKNESRGFHRKIEKTMVHPNYDGTLAYFDVGIIQTEEVEFSETVQPICLPDTFSVDMDKYKDNSVELVGLYNMLIFQS